MSSSVASFPDCPATCPRVVELEEENQELKEELAVKDEKIEGFLEREVKPIGNTGRVNCPKRFIGRRVYLIITKEEKSSD